MSLQFGSKHGQSAWCVYCAWATLLTASLMFAGCGGDKESEYRELSSDDLKIEETKIKEVAHHHDHDHEHGPNGGHLIELGEEEYHAEVVFDENSRKITVYILGADAKSAVPIAGDAIEFELEEGDDEIELAIAAAPLDGEPEGQSSRFEIAGDVVPEKIKSEEDLEGHFHITIAGKEFMGELHHDDHGHDHGDHDHDHGDKDHDHDDEHSDDEDGETQSNDEAKK
ncbi:MAG: hypothetical protein O2955_02960 [Planctomycetota bacterium]|nr:hypothetical protein [Planctomycetota bacterium]MDA1211447.1 hypothetical protein [Planctomycetota bacterium]